MNILYQLYYLLTGFVKDGREIVGLKVTKQEKGIIELRRIYRDGTLSLKWTVQLPVESLTGVTRLLNKELLIKGDVIKKEVIYSSMLNIDLSKLLKDTLGLSSPASGAVTMN